MAANNTNDKKPGGKNSVLILVVLLIVAFGIYRALSPDDASLFGRIGGNSISQTIDYSEFKALVRNKQIQNVSIGQTLIKAVEKLVIKDLVETLPPATR